MHICVVFKDLQIPLLHINFSSLLASQQTLNLRNDRVLKIIGIKYRLLACNTPASA